MQTIDGRKTNTELEEMRKEIRRLEDAAEQLATGLAEACHRNDELEAENSTLRGGRGDAYGEPKTGKLPFSWIPPNQLLLYGTGAVFVSFCLMSLLHSAPASDYELYYVTGSALRLLGQILFVLWCMGIYSRDGLKGLVKRCGLWTVGWSLVLCNLYYHHQTMKHLEYRLIDAASPVNWWILPPTSVGDAEFIPFVFLLALCLDLNSDCTYSRWVFSRLAILSDRVKEVMA